MSDMNYTVEWKRKTKRLRLIAVILIAVMISMAALSTKYEIEWLFHAGFYGMFFGYSAVLYKEWRCPHCGKQFKFWERWHRESVSSLISCSKCGAVLREI